MSESSLESTASAIKLGVFVREDYLRSRISVFKGALSYCLETTGIRAFLIPMRADHPPEQEVIAEVDGMITWASPEDEWVRDLWKSGTPVVNCNHAFLGEVPTVSAGEPYELAYTYLKGLQRSSMGFVTRNDLDAECRRRFRTRIGKDMLEASIFKDVHKDPGRFPEHILTATDEDELAKYLTDLPKPAALWCIHDEMAALVWRKATALGISVPEELALLGVGDHPCAMHSTPGITTVRIPGNQLGYEAAKLLHRHLYGGNRLEAGSIHHTESAVSIVERHSTGGTHPLNRAIQRAWRMLENYPPEGLTVDFLIEDSKISRVGFYREFERTFHISPGKAIRLSRLKKAKESLLNSDMPISQVGRICGFTGESEFSNFFKRETGKTPSEWRRNKEHYS